MITQVAISLRSFVVAVACIVVGTTLVPASAAFASFCSSHQRWSSSIPSARRFSTVAPHSFLQPKSRPYRANLYAKSSQDDDEDNEESQPRRDGMAQAFRELEELNTIDDDLKKASSSEPRKTTTPLVKLVEPTTAASTAAATATPEEEVKLYAKMVQELEENNEDGMYTDVLSEMGGTLSSTPPSTTTATTVSTLYAPSSLSSSSTSSSSSPVDEEWMNQALQEALDEAKKSSPSNSFDRASVLNDEQLMKEIVQVFDQAHEKLMAGLEEIRTEQAQWTAEQQASSSSSSSFDKNTKAEQEYRDSAERLNQAESTFTSLLDKVQKETQSVETAVQELERAQEELSKDFLLQLRQGGIVKQVTLVGALLFTLRTVGLVATTDLSATPDAMTGAIVQAGLAAAFAAAYAFTK